jgi:PAS domain S-box-containing protein
MQGDKNTHIDRDMLNQAFQAFSDTTLKFQEGYQKLEKKVAHLTNELEEKNIVLQKNIVALNNTQKYINSVLENISDGVMALDLNGMITTFNKAAQTITNFQASEIIGKSYDVIFYTQGNEKKFLNDVLREIAMLSGKETMIKNKDGEKVPVIAYSSPITDEYSCVKGVVITFNDITRIKELENAIERSKRLAALGEMAAGVAHEIRNPLGGIEMFSSLLERELANDPRKKDIAQKIIQGVRSLNKIVTGLLTFTQTLQKTHFRHIDFIDALEVSLSFAKCDFDEKAIRIEKKYESEASVFVKGDSDQLKQVFLNIFLNAAHAITHTAGVVSIGCSVFEKEGYVVAEIADNGCGMEPECLEKIFHPFFTTKAKGTGLGLAISYRIIDAHGGRLQVESKKDEGTRFLIYLPLMQGV